MSKKTERLILIFSIGCTLIALAYIFATIHKQNIEKENKRITEQEKIVDETFDIKMHRYYYEEIKELIKTHCKPEVSEGF